MLSDLDALLLVERRLDQRERLHAVGEGARCSAPSKGQQPTRATPGYSTPAGQPSRPPARAFTALAHQQQLGRQSLVTAANYLRKVAVRLAACTDDPPWHTHSMARVIAPAAAARIAPLRIRVTTSPREYRKEATSPSDNRKTRSHGGRKRTKYAATRVSSNVQFSIHPQPWAGQPETQRSRRRSVPVPCLSAYETGASSPSEGNHRLC